MKEDALTQSTNTATNYMLSFFKVRNCRQPIHLILFSRFKTYERAANFEKKQANFLKKLSNNIFSMFKIKTFITNMLCSTL